MVRWITRGWVTLAALGVFLAKSVLEVALMVRYQKQM